VRRLLPLLLLLAAGGGSDDLRLRLFRRWPACRGTLEGVYAGDGYAMFQRLRVRRESLGLTLITEKDRGEDWGDLVCGGVSWEGGPKAVVGSLSAGWLRADLGSGLVMAHPGGWGGPGFTGYEKPPMLRTRLEPASGAWGCDGHPLTGAGGVFALGEVRLAALQAVSWTDRSGDGLHRTAGELEGKGFRREVLPAVRAVAGPVGLTAAAAWTDSDSGSSEWQRGGVDLQLRRGAFLLSGEAAVGRDSGGIETAFWAGPAHESEGFRQAFLVFRSPEGFPDRRSSAPLGECRFGCRYGLRWRPAVATFLSAGVVCRVREEEDAWKAAGEVSRRLAAALRAKAGTRWTADGDGDSWRGVGALSWEPSRMVRLSLKMQLTGWSDGDSTESGSCAETRLRVRPRRWLSLRLGAAGYSTDGWRSRAYVAALAFPGQFGAEQVQGEGMLLQAAVSVEPREGLFLRAGVGWTLRDGAESIGSGYEETEGDSRTEAGLQLDWRF
jgi:hypothetical protein